MKILGEEIGGIGRWYIAAPPVLLIGFLIGMFFLAAAGQSRLHSANERVHASQLRGQALSEFITLITDAESGERGYLLTGESSYLQPYTEAVAAVETALDRVREAYGADVDGSEFRELRTLTGKKLGELGDTLAQFKKRGPAPAVNVVRTDVGKRTMDKISKIAAAMRSTEARELSAATEQWQTDFRRSRWLSAVGVILNIGLVLLATRLVYGDMRRRALQATNLRDQKEIWSSKCTSGPGNLPRSRLICRECRSRRSPLCRASCMTNSAACWWPPAWICPGFSSGCRHATLPSNSDSSAFTNP